MDWVLDIRHEALTVLFRALTFLGDATFFLVVLPLGYWLVRRDAFLRGTLLLLVTALVNSGLKGIFQLPRPEIPHLVAASGWSFPSGHAQIASVIWPWLALEMRWRRAWPLVALLVAGIAFSRVYLGVHYPIDVICGVAIGLLTVAVAWWLTRHPIAGWEKWAPRRKAGVIVAAVIVWYVVLYAVVPGGFDADSAMTGGALVGVWIGDLYQRRHLDFRPPQGVWRRIVAAILGLIVAFVLRDGLGAGLTALGLARAAVHFICFCSIGAWISFFAPWLFIRLGLAEGPATAKLNRSCL